MDYKKAYKKLKADIKKAYLFAQTDSTKAVLEHILPELRKSEDERARKRLIAMRQHYIECYAFDQFNLDGYKEALAWLEKQGSNLVKNGYTNNKDVIEYASNYSREIWHKLIDNFKNIKDYHIGCNDVSDIVLNAIINTYNWLEKQDKQKHIEKDLEMVNPSDKAEQKPAWSEEDERNLQGVIDEIEANKNQAPDYDLATYDRFLSWLKSLRPQKRWKPSKEQMDAMQMAVSYFGYSWASKEQKLLESLYKDLKKLQEE